MSTPVPASRSSSVAEQPSKVRYGVLGFACSLSMITYLDRVCFGAAAPVLAKELGLSGVADLALAFSAFAFAYAAFEVPSGWLGDVYGPRRTLIRIVIWWSVFTAITGLVGLTVSGYTIGSIPDVTIPGYGTVLGIVFSLTVIRFLFGMGEAGAYPNITRALHNWFPSDERGFTQGMVWMSGRLMGGLTPLVWGLLVAGTSFSTPLITWRGAFWLFGAMGLVWCVLFSLWFRNHPHEKAEVNAAERQLIEGNSPPHVDHSGVPWGKILSSPNLWILCIMYFCMSYGWYFNITYLPAFLKEHYAVSDQDFLGQVYKGGPLWMGAIGCLAGGFLTDRIVRRTGNQRFGRRVMGLVGHTLCAMSYATCIYAPSAFTFFLAVSLAAFFNDLTMGSAWATCQDIGRRYAAIVAGCMNTVGNMGGVAAGIITGVLIKGSQAAKAKELNVSLSDLDPAVAKAAELAGYHTALLSFAGIYVIAVLCWLLIDATKPVVTDEH